MKEAKEAAHDSGTFHPSTGYKPFAAVQVAVRDLAILKTGVYEVGRWCRMTL